VNAATIADLEILRSQELFFGGKVSLEGVLVRSTMGISEDLPPRNLNPTKEVHKCSAKRQVRKTARATLEGLRPLLLKSSAPRAVAIIRTQGDGFRLGDA